MTDHFPDAGKKMRAIENAQEAMKQAHTHLMFAAACNGVTVLDSVGVQETCEALHEAIEGLKPLQAAAQRQQDRIAELEAQVQALSLDAGRYRQIRRGQKWSVIDGIGDQLRGESLDAAIDAAIAAGKGEA